MKKFAFTLCLVFLMIFVVPCHGNVEDVDVHDNEAGSVSFYFVADVSALDNKNRMFELQDRFRLWQKNSPGKLVDCTPTFLYEGEHNRLVAMLVQYQFVMVREAAE